MIAQSWDTKALRKMAERAYNYRYYIGKDQFQSLFRFMEILELAEANDIDISDPQKFQNFITRLRTEYEKIQSEKSEEFRKTHARQSKKKSSHIRGLSNMFGSNRMNGITNITRYFEDNL
jgi:hypothetical protein